jgi:CHAD domain-containing protein
MIALLKRWVERKSSLKWRTALESAAAQAEENFCKANISQTARQMLPAMAVDFFKQGDQAAADKVIPKELHRFRLTCKKFRYTLELFTPLDGDVINSKLEAIRRGQMLLGDISDYETVRNMLSQYEDAEPITAWLRKRQRKKLLEFREYWTTTFDDKNQRRDWLESLKRLASEARATKKPAGQSTRARITGRGSAAVA